VGALRSGVHLLLEEEANRLIRDSLKGVTKHSAKSDILTPWKETERRRKEVYVSSGIPDASLRKGMFHRAASTHLHLNSTDGHHKPRKIAGSMSGFVEKGRTYDE